MVQQSSGPDHPDQCHSDQGQSNQARLSQFHPHLAAASPLPVLTDTIAKLSAFNLHVSVAAVPAAQHNWIDAETLASPQNGALADLLDAFKANGIAPNRKAASASLLLRFGWAGGFAIGAYLVCRRVPTLRAYALSFSPVSLLHSVWVRDVLFAGVPDDPLSGGGYIESVGTSDLPKRLLESLVAFTEPIVATQHAWSGFSRHALWAMVTSSWAGQFTNIARQIGDESRGVREAKALFDLMPELKRAAPEMYAVQGGKTMQTCQKRSACCLYFKSSTRHFCASCPIIPESERLERNRAWVEQQPILER